MTATAAADAGRPCGMTHPAATIVAAVVPHARTTPGDGTARICRKCGKEFTPMPSRPGYICTACDNKAGKARHKTKGERIEKICRICGRSFILAPSQRSGARCSACLKKKQYANRLSRNEPWLNIEQKIANRLRIRMQKVIKYGSGVNDLGCSISEFKDYIAKKFQPGMSWDNYGQWHLDHIRPLSSFDLTDREQFLQAAHYTNYQPLWAADNIKKSNRLV